MAMMGKKRGDKDELGFLALWPQPLAEAEKGKDCYIPSSTMVYDLLMQIRSPTNTGPRQR